MDIKEFHTKQYDDETQVVAQVARQIRREHPTATWTECIIAAEKSVKEARH